MKKIVFRFDIDTHKCIRDVVPKLLNISEKYDIPFTFFLNTGKSISFNDSIYSMIVNDKKCNEDIKMMSALYKLGVKDYFFAALLNPNIIRYKKQVKRLLDSNCEVGVHGGDNHAKWQLYASKWNEAEIKCQIERAIERIRRIKPDYKLTGFASPAFNSPESLKIILKEIGFKYMSDFHGICLDSVIIRNEITEVGVNLLGEPGGVAFWENCRVNGLTNNDIISLVSNAIDKNEITVVYDHPYYAGVRECDSIIQVIELCKEKNCKISTLESLI